MIQTAKSYFKVFRSRKGMSTTLKILFGAFLMVILLGLIVLISNTLFSRGLDMTEVLSIENYLPGGGGS